VEPPKPIDPNYSEDWPQGRSRIETAAHVHAFGMIGLNASMLEEILLLLLLTYLPMGHEEAIRLTTRLNNRDRADWLAALMNAETNPEFADHVNHGILCCNICFDNRNMLCAFQSGRKTPRSANSDLKCRSTAFARSPMKSAIPSI
jgi:hypothetical protein